MARKRKVESDDDGDYADSDASFKPKKKRGKDTVGRKPAKRQTSLKGNGRKRDLPDAEYMDESETADSPEVLQTCPHPVSLHVISHAAPLREVLLRWYEGVHTSRGMPWRKPYDHSWNMEQKAQRAYEVWVSEIMLQQTQVATVIPYYDRWMEKFPTITDLAASDIDTVNGLWKGLGYYSRAARLLSGAQKAVEEFKGRLPDNAKDMENKIPGIGRYSAGAICSIAYNECVPVLDGNVHRVLSRVLALHAPPKAKQTLDILWAGASALVEDADSPGDLNQALIDLGATVCKGADSTKGSRPSKRHTPTPDIEELCTLCEPLPDGSLITIYPMKPEKKKVREELDIVNVIEWRKDRNSDASNRWFLLVRRPEGGLLAGLHEFPTAVNVSVASPPANTKIAGTLLSALLTAPPASSSPSSSSRSRLVSKGEIEIDSEEEHELASEQDTGLRIQATRRPQLETKPTPVGPTAATTCPSAVCVVKIVPAGDVLHIFSHIRKTYRVQWVVLEGGSADGPPPLVQQPASCLSPDPGPAIPKTTKGKGVKGKSKTPSRKHRQPAISPSPSPTQQPQRNISDSNTIGNNGEAVPNSHRPPGAQWVMLDAVADANIGTGVLKVWRQVRALWEDSDDVAADG